MLIIGIDPGISITGWGVIDFVHKDKINFLSCGCIKTSSSSNFSKRLLDIHTNIKFVIDKYKPEVAAIEELYFLKIFKSISHIIQARGVIILTLSMNNVPIFEYNPKSIKLAITGYGLATKIQIQNMIKTFLCLEKIPKPDDVADALAVAICHANTKKF
jgi:crossover junction endodeoxyribonuclease RuvC